MGLKNEGKLHLNVDYKLSIPTANYIDKYGPNKKGMYVTYWNYIGQAEKIFDPTTNFIVNDNLIISMEAILSVQKKESVDVGSDSKMPLECSFSKLSFGDSAIQLWESDDKDFDIIVEEKEIKVHKCVLGTKSPVFDRMIQSGLKEEKENKVLITDFDFDVVETGIKFCYGIEEKHLWNVENGLDVPSPMRSYKLKNLNIYHPFFIFMIPRHIIHCVK